jgi:hypothetical protein
MKQLYTVTIHSEQAVLADSEADAVRIAKRCRYKFDPPSLDVRPMRRVPEGLDGFSVPYADKGEPERDLATLIAAGHAPNMKGK